MVDENKSHGNRVCEQCGYVVDGLPQGRTGEKVCPECGAAVSWPRQPVDFPIVKIGLISAGIGVLPYIVVLLLIDSIPFKKRVDAGILTCGGILLSLCIAWITSAVWASRYISAKRIVGKNGIAACMLAAMACDILFAVVLTFFLPLFLGH